MFLNGHSGVSTYVTILSQIKGQNSVTLELLRSNVKFYFVTIIEATAKKINYNTLLSYI